jgi:predicted GH43/DUF377 family glycosyl hydrolase
MRYLGDYAEDATLHFKFNTIDESGDPVTLAGTPSVCVYKADGTTQSTAGVEPIVVDFDSITGLHHVEIDLSVDAFYATGNDYQVTIAAGTVDGNSVVGVVLADFSIENRAARTYLGTNLGALGANATALATSTALATVDGNVDTLVESILSEGDSTDLLQIVADLKNDGRLDLLIDAILEDTGTALPAAIAAGAVAGGSGSTLRNEIHRLAGIDEGTIHGSDLLFALEADETAATWPARPQKISSTWYLFYTAKVSGTNRIRLKTSADGESWSGATDILTPGGSGEWDEGGIWCPQFFAVDGTYYLFYTGYDASGEGVSVGLATSSTVNSGYSRHGSNPLLTAAAGDFRQGSVEVTGMAQFGGTYYMYLTNLSVNDNDMPAHARKIWYATSDDLTTWTQSTTPIFGDADTSSDRQPGIGYYSASPFASGDYYYLLVAKYGPYNDFSRFELWEADSPTFSADSRRFVKTVLVTQDLGTWPDHEVDICHVATDDIGADTYSLTGNEIWIYFGAKHNRSGTRKWETGLMKYGSLYELLRPTPLITEPIIDRLPQTRWAKAGKELEGYNGYSVVEMIGAIAATDAGDPTIDGTSFVFVMPGGSEVTVSGTATSAGDRSGLTWTFTA